MPKKEGEIISSVSVPRASGGWTEKGSASCFKIISGSVRTAITAAAKHDCTDHAEMRALSCVSSAELHNVRLEQNAFPCEKCHAALLEMSSASVITIDVSADKGEYSSCHRIGGLTVTEVPIQMVYQAGHASYGGTRDDARIHT